MIIDVQHALSVVYCQLQTAFRPAAEGDHMDISGQFLHEGKWSSIACRTREIQIGLKEN